MCCQASKNCVLTIGSASFWLIPNNLRNIQTSHSQEILIFDSVKVYFLHLLDQPDINKLSYVHCKLVKLKFGMPPAKTESYKFRILTPSLRMTRGTVSRTEYKLQRRTSEISLVGRGSLLQQEPLLAPSVVLGPGYLSVCLSVSPQWAQCDLPRHHSPGWSFTRPPQIIPCLFFKLVLILYFFTFLLYAWPGWIDPTRRTVLRLNYSENKKTR